MTTNATYRIKVTFTVELSNPQSETAARLRAKELLSSEGQIMARDLATEVTAVKLDGKWYEAPPF